MKMILPLFLLALAACDRPGQADIVPYEIFSENAPFQIDPAKPPEGMHIVQILLQRQHILVDGTGCASPFDSRRTLGHYVAMMLGSSIDPGPLKFQLNGGCKVEWLEKPDSSRMDFWRCHLGTSNIDNGKSNVQVSAGIYFGVTQDKWEFIPEKLMCQ